MEKKTADAEKKKKTAKNKVATEKKDAPHDSQVVVSVADGTSTKDPGAIGPLKTILILLVCTLVAAAGVAHVLTTYTVTREPLSATSSPIEASAPEPSITFKSVLLPRYGFNFELPSTWRSATSAPTLPASVTKPKQTYQHQSGACYASYAEFDTAHSYSNKSEPTELTKDGEIITYVVRRVHNDTNTSPAEHRGDVVTAFYPLFYDNTQSEQTYNSWVLFGVEDTISEQCYDDFVLLLSSLKPHVESIRSTEDLSGTLYIEQDDMHGARLLFRDSESSIPYLVRTLDVGRINKPLYDEGYLYYIGTNGTLKRTVLNTQDNDVEILPFVRFDGDSVNDYFLYGNNVFFLVGVWCQDTDAACNLRLYEYDFEADALYSYAEGVSSNKIAGYSSDQKRIYLRYESQEGSTLNETWETFDIAHDSYDALVTFTVQTDNPSEYEQYKQERAEIETQMTHRTKGIPGFSFDAGTISQYVEPIEGIVPNHLPIAVVE